MKRSKETGVKKDCNQPPTRKLLPWPLGVAGIFVLAMVACCVVAGVMLYPRLKGKLIPQAGVYGTYVNQDNPDEYLELREDGTFYLKEIEVGFTGEWEVKGDVLRLYLSELGLAVEGTLERDRIIDDDGKVWVRRSGLPSNTISPVQNAIIGKWEKVVEPEVVIEFLRDGTLIARGTETGSYEFIDGDTIRMTLPGYGPQIVEVRIAGDTLTLSDGGASEIYRRVP